MQRKFEVVSLIPARSGSKGIKDKNIYKINSKPLIYYTIKTALKAKYINKNFVFTDSSKYKKICENQGIEFPFDRGKINSKHDSLDIDVIKEFLSKFFMHYKYYPSILVYLRPTQPLRTSKLIDNCILKLKKSSSKISMIRTVRKAPYPPYWMKKIIKNRIYPLTNSFKKMSNQRRQYLPESFICDGYVDAFKVKTFMHEMQFPTNKQIPYLNEDIPFLDIDEIEDIKLLKYYLNK